MRPSRTRALAARARASRAPVSRRVPCHAAPCTCRSVLNLRGARVRRAARSGGAPSSHPGRYGRRGVGTLPLFDDGCDADRGRAARRARRSVRARGVGIDPDDHEGGMRIAIRMGPDESHSFACPRPRPRDRPRRVAFVEKYHTLAVVAAGQGADMGGNTKPKLSFSFAHLEVEGNDIDFSIMQSMLNSCASINEEIMLAVGWGDMAILAEARPRPPRHPRSPRPSHKPCTQALHTPSAPSTPPRVPCTPNHPRCTLGSVQEIAPCAQEIAPCALISIRAIAPRPLVPLCRHHGGLPTGARARADPRSRGPLSRAAAGAGPARLADG